jgi:uncharacterized protein (DUF1501 family)
VSDTDPPPPAIPSGDDAAPPPESRGLSRRQFLSGGLAAGAAGAAALYLSRSNLFRGGGPHPAPVAPNLGNGVLVLVTLYGGNDGLNTVIPYEDGAYLGGRAQLGYQPQEVIPLAEGLGLHPDLKGLKAVWDAKHLAIVRGVGYPNPNRSHFRSMDIWQSASPDKEVRSGWLGRWLDKTGTDPLHGLAVGPTLPLALTGEKVLGGAVPVGNLQLPGGPRLEPIYAALETPTGGQSALAAQIARSGADLLHIKQTLADALDQVPAGGTQPGTNLEGGQPAAPAGAAGAAPKRAAGANALATQLDLVSRTIRAGVPTRAYAVSLGGFDTHANEKDTHARLMGQLDTALTGFLDSLHGDRQGDGTVVLVHSEFGRRVAANASGGTDHGTAAPVLVLGPGVKGGFYGDEPSLTDLDRGDLKFTTDFRSVYATVLGHVLGFDPADSLGQTFPTLAFL